MKRLGGHIHLAPHAYLCAGAKILYPRPFWTSLFHILSLCALSSWKIKFWKVGDICASFCFVQMVLQQPSSAAVLNVFVCVSACV